MSQWAYIYAGETIEFTHEGVEYVATIERDDFMGTPWEEHDGHGTVSEWTTREKTPGELVIAEDGNSRRYYDFAEACQIARRDGWDAKPYNDGTETKRQQAAKAARADFEHLRDWCNDEWFWCGVVIRRAGDCECCGETASLWGIESNAGDYLRDVAIELIGELPQKEVA